MAKELLLNRSLKMVAYTFRWCGLNLESNISSPSKYSKEKMFYLFTLIWIFATQISATWWCVESAIEGKASAFTALTYLAPCILIATLANAKSIYMAVNESVLYEILHILRGLEMKHNDREKNVEKQEIIKKETSFLDFVLKFMNFFNLLLIVSVSGTPLIQTLIEYFKSRSINLLLPFMLKYPFEVSSFRNWILAYIGQTFGSFIGMLEMNSIDYIFYICVSYLCLQLKLLQYDIRMMFSENGLAAVLQPNGVVSTVNSVRRRGSTFVPLYDDAELRREFARLVNWHQELLHVVKLLEIIYSKSTLFNFITSSILICLSGFNVLIIREKLVLISLVSFVFANILQIFVFCYFGDMLTQCSMNVSDAIYESKWYLASPAFRKLLLIMHLRASSPCKLTASGYADVNLIAFSRIISTSWSYLALLQTVYSTPN